MNLSGDQEKFARIASQALVEWRESLGAFAWVILGLCLVLGVVASIATLRWIRRGGLRSHGHGHAARGSHEP